MTVAPYRLSIIPGGAVTDPSLEPRDLQVLCLLGRHTDKQGWCFRSQVRMAEELRCGRSSIQRSIDRLIDAGWVEKKLRAAIGAGTPDPKHPHVAHSYRVVLDRDDLIDVSASDLSHDESADQGPGCPPVGTPLSTAEASEIAASVEAQNGHPGAQPSVGTGCPPIRGHMNDPKEPPQLEPERERVRARDKEARGLADFEARWPTAATDDRQRTAYAWASLTETERDSAINEIGRFLEKLKHDGRKHTPAGWKYLEEKRWTLLEVAEKSAGPVNQKLAAGSPEAKAVAALYTIAGRANVLSSLMRSNDGGLFYRKEITPQLLALAQAPPHDAWIDLDHRQAGSWNDLLAAFVTIEVWHRLRAGSRGPWPWPPRKDGSLCTGPPDGAGTGEDLRELANEKG